MKVYIVDTYTNEKYNYFGKSKRFLVYANRKKPGYEEIEESELSKDEKEWLNYCKTMIASEEMKNGNESNLFGEILKLFEKGKNNGRS